MNIYDGLLNALGVEFNKKEHGVPYMWAQRLCGVNFPHILCSGNTANVDTKHDKAQKSTISTFKAIRKRLEVRLDLCYQMNDVEKTVLPAELSMSSSFIPVNATSKLTKWESLSWESYQKLPYTSFMVEENIVSHRDIFYKATFTNGTANLFATIALKSNYPASVPLYSLQLQYNNNISDAKNDDNIRDIERELNVYYEEYMSGLDQAVYLLLSQLYRISFSLDIYLECTDPINYSKNKLFLHRFRTRVRNLPLKYVYHAANEGIFVQR